MAAQPYSKQLEDLCREHDAWEQVDKSEFQRSARLLQSLWRQDRGLPLGTFRGKRRGALLEMPLARETQAGYLTPIIREVVRREVLSPERDLDKLSAASPGPARGRGSGSSRRPRLLRRPGRRPPGDELAHQDRHRDRGGVRLGLEGLVERVREADDQPSRGCFFEFDMGHLLRGVAAMPLLRYP